MSAQSQVQPKTADARQRMSQRLTAIGIDHHIDQVPTLRSFDANEIGLQGIGMSGLQVWQPTWALDALVSVKSQQLIHDQDVMRQLLAWYITQARALTIEGPTGCGKTEAAAAFVAALGQPYLLAECHPETTLPDLIGYQTLDGFVWGPVGLAAVLGLTVVMSEDNLLDGAVKAALNNTIDGAPIYVPRLKKAFEVAQTFRMISTRNPRGFGMQGRRADDSSALRRQTWIVMDYPSREREEQILTAHAQVLTQRYGTVHQEALGRLIPVCLAVAHDTREAATGAKGTSVLPRALDLGTARKWLTQFVSNRMLGVDQPFTSALSAVYGSSLGPDHHQAVLTFLRSRHADRTA